MQNSPPTFDQKTPWALFISRWKVLRLHEKRLHALKVVQVNEPKDVSTTQKKSAFISSPTAP